MRILSDIRLKRIYLAARWSRREEIEGYATALKVLGFDVTSRWLTDPDHRLADQPDAQAFNAKLATHDYEDVRSADAVVYFAPGGTRGGSHVEFGMGLALGKRLFWIGEREHVFSWLDHVEVWPNPSEFLAYLRGIANPRPPSPSGSINLSDLRAQIVARYEEDLAALDRLVEIADELAEKLMRVDSLEQQNRDLRECVARLQRTLDAQRRSA